MVVGCLTRCNKCGSESVVWDREYHRLNGKWRLKPHVTLKGNVCGDEEVLMSNIDTYFHCGLCESNYGYCPDLERLDRHIRIWHPNNEHRTFDDFVVYKQR